METIQNFWIEENIPVAFHQASSFPDGVLAAHQEIHAKFPPENGRRYFGISHPDKWTIIYKAAAEQLYPGEAAKHGFSEFVIHRGVYTSIKIPDFHKNIPQIGQAFQKLLTDSRIDPKGYCLEWYINDHDLICLVPLNADETKRHELIRELDPCFKNLIDSINSMNEDSLNQVPFSGSWTAAQVGHHLLRSTETVINTLKGKTGLMEAGRESDRAVAKLEKVFLDFTRKFEAAEFLIPSNERISKSSLLDSLKEKTAELLDILRTEDLSLVCLDFAFPGSNGHMTRLEWGHFTRVHTKRHLHQLQNIMEKL